MLKGERVILRPIRSDDIARQHDFNQDIELYGLMNSYPRVSPLEKAQAFYESRTKPDDDLAPFAIEADGKYIGHCTLTGLKHPHGNLNLSILIGDRAYWGRGYGREVVRLLLDYGFYYLGGRFIGLTTHAKNERALRCFKACGFVEECRPRKEIWVEGEYTDLVKMSILRSEWKAIHLLKDSEAADA